jgi:hypothetical protein
VLTALLALGAGCGSTAAAPPRPAAGASAVATIPPASSSPPQADGTTTATTDRYVALAQTLHRDGVQVWFEADLVKAWLAGPTAFATAAGRLGDLAAATDVTGFKVADEIGYDDGLTSVTQATAFLRDVRDALGKVAPGREILIDAVVLDLGCLPWRDATGRACAQQADARHPAASFTALDSYLRSGLVDRLDLSTGLLTPGAYAARGTTIDGAQREAWHHVLDAGWDRLTTLQSRKALAAPGGYQGDAQQADADLRLHVDLPVAGGAHAVDIWTWRQSYQGAVVGLLGPDLRSNALWVGLRQRRDRGVTLFTHMTPSMLPPSPDSLVRECAVAAQVFGAVFVAAGTG